MKRRLSRSPSPTITVSSTPWAPRKRRRHSIPYGTTSAKTVYETPSPKRRHILDRQRRIVYDKDNGYEADVEFFASNKRHRMPSTLPRTSAPHPSPTRPSLMRLNIKNDAELVTALDNLHVSRCVRVRISEPTLNGAFRMTEMDDKSIIRKDVNEAEMVHAWGASGRDQTRKDSDDRD